MIKIAVVIICFCLMLALCSCSLAVNSEASDVAGGISVPAYPDVVILTTTDMHGKCWSNNILTESTEINNMHLGDYEIDSALESQIAARYGEGPIECRDGARIDHTDVDLTIASVAVSNDYVVKPGNITPKDIWQLYRYPNRIAVIPMYGYEIRNVMEENAAERLTV